MPDTSGRSSYPYFNLFDHTTRTNAWHMTSIEPDYPY